MCKLKLALHTKSHEVIGWEVDWDKFPNPSACDVYVHQAGDSVITHTIYIKDVTPISKSTVDGLKTKNETFFLEHFAGAKEINGHVEV